jgi:hypothetical protein
VLGLAQVVLIHEGAEVVVILNGLRAAQIRGSRVTDEDVDGRVGSR